MRRKGERKLPRQRYDTPPSWLLKRLTEGETPVLIWSQQLGWTLDRLSKATRIDPSRLMDLHHTTDITDDEAERIGAAMLVAPHLLTPPPY